MDGKESGFWKRSGGKINGVFWKYLETRRKGERLQGVFRSFHSIVRMPLRKHRNDLSRGDSQEKCDVIRGNGLLKEILNTCPYSEHSMTLSQLNDVYPLSRINCQDARKSAGMNDDEVSSSLIENGRNLVQPPKKRRSQRILLFIAQFLNTFRLLLLLAALVCFLIFILDTTRRREMLMAIFLTAILIIMCIASYVQQGNISKQIRGFQSIIPGECTVQRQGRDLRIQANGVARGDLVWLRIGDRVPADCRLLVTDDLRVETSWVTGEVCFTHIVVEPLEYHSGTAEKKESVFESQNVVFAGCSVTSGEGLGLVIRTGNNALIGKLVHITSQEKPTPSWLENEHKKFVRFITIVALCISSVTFCVGLAIKGDQHLINTFINGFLIVVVASVPQGLPVTLTAQLIIVARRLTKIGMFLKRVDVADTLGLTSVLLTDKSGVLTSNQMKVMDVWFEEELLVANGLNSSKDTDSKKLMKNPCFKRILEVMSVCDRAQIRSPKRKLRKVMSKKDNEECMTPKWSTTSKAVCVPLHHTTSLRQKSVAGKATDVALIKFVEQIVPAHELREGYDIVYELPFSAQRRFQLVIAREKKVYDSDDESDTSSNTSNQMARFVLMVKGAPEELIRNCSTVRTKKDTEQLDGEKISKFEDIYSRLASDGKSCIAFAELEFQDFWDASFIDRHAGTPLYPETGWCFLGMAAIFDKPLPEVRVAVHRAKEAGIKLFMVTGDHPTTAEAVAKQIGFFDEIEAPKGSSSSSSGCSSASDCSSSIGGRSVEIIHGDTLNDLTEVEWKKLLSERHVIFARTTPSQKLMIIEQCHHLGEVVTMTGDGLMDAKALKQADTGIAIDGAGSVFAKEAADVVTTTADLSKIMNAISEGRLLFDNLRKTIAYTLSHLQPELLPVLFSFVLGLPLGLTSVQVLTVDLLTELPPSIALIFEPAERDNMKRPPRRKSSHLVTGPMLWYSYVIAGNLIGLGCTLAYFTVFWHHGFSISDALFTSDQQWLPSSPNITASHTGQVFDGFRQVMVHQEACAAWQITLVMSQVLHLWQCSTRRISIFRHGIRNWILVLAVLFEVGFLMCLIFLPWLQKLVEVRPPPTIIWVYPLCVGVCLLVFNETRKYVIRQNKNKKLIKLVKW